MIICAKAKRNADGTIDAAAAADIQAVREQDVASGDGEAGHEEDGGDAGRKANAQCLMLNAECIMSNE